MVKNIICGIFTSNRKLADHILEKIYEQLKSDNKEIKHVFAEGRFCKEICLLNGDVYKWINPIESSRANRVTKAYIDRSIDEDTLHLIVLPCLVGPRDIIYIDESEMEE
jgi:hypothetical protein